MFFLICVWINGREKNREAGDLRPYRPHYDVTVMYCRFIHILQGAVSIRKTVLPGMAIHMLKIRRPNGRLIFNMEIAIRREDGLYIETGPRLSSQALGNHTVAPMQTRQPWRIMMTSSNGNIFRVTGHLCGEFTGPRWIPRTKASDAELWCLLWPAPE